MSDSFDFKNPSEIQGHCRVESTNNQTHHAYYGVLLFISCIYYFMKHEQSSSRRHCFNSVLRIILT